MRKLIILFSLVLLCSESMFSQLTTRSNDASEIRCGTRPLAGDYAVFFGPSLANINEMRDENISNRGLPYMNLKYYSTDRLELRLGVQVHKTRTKIEGDLVKLTNGTTLDRDMSSIFRLMPGFAYHFAPQNLLDVYTGLEFPFGTERYASENRYEYSNGDYNYYKITKGTFVVGYNFFFGAQAFIADLPFAVGFEYGIMGLKHMGLSYKNETESKVGSTKTSQTFYTTSTSSSSTQYKKLSYKSSEVGGDVRLTVTYFFTR
jgi:hypothetical protein